MLSKLTSKDEAVEQFIAIEIGPESLNTAVWKIVSGKTQIVSTGSSAEWDPGQDSDEKLLEAIDLSLQKSLADIEPEPNQVIFGLQESWVEGQKVIGKYAKTLKLISEKFGFRAIGFVVTVEAITHLLKVKEGTPPTAVLIRVSELEVQVSIVDLGKTVGSQTVSRSEDIVADLEEGLARIEVQENYPSRMLLFDGAFDLEALKQDLLSYDWFDKLEFLHFPRVDVLEKDIAVKAIAIAGGSEAAKALGIEAVAEQLEAEKSDRKQGQSDMDQAPSKAAASETQVSDMESAQASILAADAIGFQKEKNVSDLQAPPADSEPDQPAKLKKKTPEPDPEETFTPEPDLASDEPFLAFVPDTLGKLKSAISALTDVFAAKLKLSVLAIIAFFFIVIGLAVYAYWDLPKAEVVLYLRPKTFDKEIIITIDSDISQVNAIEGIIPGKMLETELEESQEKETTGTRLVGEKAKGEVTIYNKTSAEKTFSEATAMIGPDGLEFTTDSEVSVASASSQETEDSLTTVFGKNKVALTAKSIGSEYNLPASSQFRIEAFSTSSYDAKNEEEFTGGSSREVQAVSQNDVDSLIENLKLEIREKAASRLENQEGGIKKVLAEAVEIQVISQDLSAEVGDEAEKISATLRMKVSTLAYDDQDFQQIVKDAVSGSVPSDFELSTADSSFEVRDAEVLDGSLKLSVIYKAALIPRINKEEVKRNLSGRYPKLAEDYLRSLPNFSKAEINISPEGIPAKLKTFPKKSENIKVEIKVEEN